MSKKSIWLSVAAMLLLAVYVYGFRDWLKRDSIQVIYQIRANRLPGGAGTTQLSFLLNGKYRLTSVKVVLTSEAAKKNARPLWHLIAGSNSLPTKAILYGLPVPGMKPAAPSTAAQPLQAGAHYTLLLEAGRARGQADFISYEEIRPPGQ